MSKAVYFNKFVVNHEVFFTSKLSYLIVNLKPLVPGHVLVVPNRVVARLKDLTPLESQDLFDSLQKVQKFIEHEYKADSLNIGIQDGVLLGQSVPHVHIHIIPRYFTDAKGDQVYPEMEENEMEMLQRYVNSEKLRVDESKRVNRTYEEVELEAKWLRQRYEIYTKQQVVVK